MPRRRLMQLVCLCGSIVMLLALSSCSWPAAGAPRLCVTPAAEHDSSCLNHGKAIGAWYDLHMVDPSNGWASTYSAILHTSDGGQHWKSVTPWQLFSPWGHTANYINANVAWVLQQSNSDDHIPAQVFSTHDGGFTWQSASLPDTSATASSTSYVTAAGVFAADGQDAWAVVRALYYPPHNPDNIQVSFVHFWRSQDGGKHWALALDALPQNTVQQVPPGGYLWVTFPSAQNGFMSEVRPQSLLATSDAGQTWHRQLLPSIDQTDIESGTMLLDTPTYMSPADGILPVTALHGNRDGQFVYVYYVTRDGGAHWQPTPPLILSGSQPTNFITATHWAVLADNGTLYQTYDAGLTWSQVAVKSPFRRLRGVRFLSSTEAWAIADNDTHRGSFKGAESDLTVPARSVDGGITWTAVTPYSVD
jgi:photosystem II stability/assembly factor-like uncharacterized protein